jgi:tetrapyrrole methylase family protein/MazG family protein
MEPFRIVAAGWRREDLTLGACDALREASLIILRTGRCACADWLKEEGIPFETTDYIYETSRDFDVAIELTARAVIDMASSCAGRLVYCVSNLGDRTVKRIMNLSPERVILSAGVSAEGILSAHAGGRYHVFPAIDFDGIDCISAKVGTVVTELDSRLLASEVKVRLTRHYPDEHDIYTLDANGAMIRPVKLRELDMMDEYGHTVCAYIPPVESLTELFRYDFNHLCDIMRILRGPSGCPWDKKQTHISLKANMIEEANEAIDAINSGDMAALIEELGDVLLQVALHAEIARQHGEFDIMDITTAICLKLISRHPHVFAGEAAETVEDAFLIWQQAKENEKNHKK